jgi:hypothetical protein
MTRLLSILFLFLPLCLMAGGLDSDTYVVTHKGTVVYGDASVDENGHVTLLNGKTVEQAAATFWAAARAKHAALSALIKQYPSQVKVKSIGFEFSGNHGIIVMRMVDRHVGWIKYDPDASDREFWDAVCLIYTPQ